MEKEQKLVDTIETVPGCVEINADFTPLEQKWYHYCIGTVCCVQSVVNDY